MTNVTEYYDRYEAALAKGYVDLEAIYQARGFVDMDRVTRNLCGLIYTRVKDGKDVFLFDPRGRVTEEIGTRIIRRVHTTQVEATMRFDADQPWDDECQRVADLACESEITLTPVMGKKGLGYRVVLNPEFQELVHTS